ncbi:hypothetical protein J2S89_004115, partial [Arthrobacter bambusae]|nr:hypothetical protein [Arthrobacter bambusae]MDQ0100375.1 hypothetical protein [Arthrobacter bambusae]
PNQFTPNLRPTKTSHNTTNHSGVATTP